MRLPESTVVSHCVQHAKALPGDTFCTAVESAILRFRSDQRQAAHDELHRVDKLSEHFSSYERSIADVVAAIADGAAEAREDGEPPPEMHRVAREHHAAVRAVACG